MSRLPVHLVPASVTPTRRNLALAAEERERLKADGLLACSVPSCVQEPRIRLHHVVPLEIGGEDAPSNMLPLCHDHHTVAHRMIRDQVEGALNRSDLPGLLSARYAREEVDALVAFRAIRRSTPEQVAEHTRWARAVLDGATLGELRALKGRTQAEVGTALGVSQVQASRIERGGEEMQLCAGTSTRWGSSWRGSRCGTASTRGAW